MGLFKKIGLALKKTREAWARKFDAIFSKGELNDEFFENLTDILVSSDVGFEALLMNFAYMQEKTKLEKRMMLNKH